MTVLLLGAYFLKNSIVSPRYKQTPQVADLKQIMVAVAAYHETHGTYPFHPNGSEDAIHLLQVFLDSEHVATSNVAASWEYLNEENIDELDSRRIIIVSRDSGSTDGEVCFALKNGRIVTRGFRLHPGRELLDCYLADDGFVVHSKATFERWTATMPKSCEWRTITENGVLTRMECVTHGITFDYSYSDKALSARSVMLTDGSRIHEEVILDDLGRISHVVSASAN